MIGTRCVRPGAVTPEEIMAYVDGEAPSTLAQHVRGCPHCAAEAQDLSRVQRELQRALYRFDCPPALLLGEYELGLVTPEARTQIARHVLDCSRCAEELQVLRSSLAADFLAEAAPEVGLAERVRRVVATLFVPPPSPAYAALRGPGQDAARTYHADGLSITLGPGPQAQRGRVALIGLIVQEDAAAESLAGSQAHLIAPGGESETAEIDELGNFGFDDIAPGTYQIELRLPGQIVVIEDVGVGT